MQTPDKPMLRLFQYLKPYNGQLSFASTTSVLNKVLDLMPPVMVGWIIDTVSGAPPNWIQEFTKTSDNWTIAIFCSILIVVVFALESLFEWMYQLNFMRLAQRVQNDLRVDTYNKLQQREIAFFEKERTGNLMSMMNDDINQLERFLNSGFSELLQLFVLVVFATITITMVSWEMAIIGMLPIPFILIGSFYYQKKIGPHYGNIRESVGELSNRLENNISGISVIKSFTAELFELKRVKNASDNYQKVNFGAIRLSAIFVPLIRMLIAFGMAGAMLLGAYWILNGTGKITIGELTFFSMMIQRLLWPFTRLGQISDTFERARSSAKRVFGLMDAPNQLPDPEQPVALDKVEGNITFKNVHFSYIESTPIIKGMNFTVPAGKMIGFAGTTGAGKSTIVKLMLRLYDVDDGQILLEGKDLRTLRKKDIRAQIALVSQDVYLFHGTIAENIAYSKENASQQQLEAAAVKAELHDYIKSLPNGYDTIVGERGIKLSGGQRQRLSLARAILKDAPILILDEATSSVDTETERAIQRNLMQLTSDKTAIVIAHRLSTIRQANCIYILDEGQIVESGTHNDLLTHNGVYAGLWNVQTGVLEE